MNLKDMLSFNLQMKLLSLLLATLLWLFVTLEADDEIELPLSVSYASIPAGLTVTADPESGFRVRIEGPRILLLRQKLLGVSARLDLSEAREGVPFYSGIERSVRLIKGVKPLRLSPSGVELTLKPQQ